MFELVITFCLITGDGSIQCKIPARGLYLNEEACKIDMAKAPAVVLERLDSYKAPVASVEARCQPRGQTPVKS